MAAIQRDDEVPAFDALSDAGENVERLPIANLIGANEFYPVMLVDADELGIWMFDGLGCGYVWNRSRNLEGRAAEFLSAEYVTARPRTLRTCAGSTPAGCDLEHNVRPPSAGRTNQPQREEAFVELEFGPSAVEVSCR